MMNTECFHSEIRMLHCHTKKVIKVQPVFTLSLCVLKTYIVRGTELSSGFSSAPRTPLTAGVTGGHNKGALGLLVLNILRPQTANGSVFTTQSPASRHDFFLA